MKIRAVVDQIEVDKALLLLDSEQKQAIWPLECLPAEIKEGDIVYFQLEVDKEETQKIKKDNKERIAKLLKKTKEMDKDQSKE